MAVTRKWKALTVKTDNVAAMFKAVDTLTSNKLYVGIPNTTATRPPDPTDEPGEDINNAQLAAIHNNGSPARNIPARPFMTMGVQDSKDVIVQRMFVAGQLALSGKPEMVLKALNALGLTVAANIQKRLIAGPWVPLTERTLMAKARQRKADRKKIDKARIAGDSGAIDAILGKYSAPLINTSRLVKAITYVIRKK